MNWRDAAEPGRRLHAQTEGHRSARMRENRENNMKTHGVVLMRANSSLTIRIAALFVLALALAPAVQADTNKPWDLRNQYKIPIERGVLVYAEDTAEWRVLMDGGQVLADRIGFCVVLEDGTEMRGIGLTDGISGREKFTDAFGEGTVYSVAFPPKNGVRIVHSLKTYRNRPFVFIEIAVENVSQADVKIAAIRPVIAEKSVMQSLSDQATVRHRRILDTGGQPVVAPGKDATMAVIHDPSKPICFGVGLIPQGLARSTVSFKEVAGEWHGDITCNYEPYKLLKPGAKLVSDPLWISHGVPEPDRVDLNYSWVYSTLVKVAPRPFNERGWYTLASDKGLDAYVQAAGDWKKAGIDHVLLGRGWEGRPGSMEGAAGRFPDSMKSAVADLSKAGLKVGVTIEPLASKGDGAGTAKSADGLSWLNPAVPESGTAFLDKIKSLKGWDVAFVVVDYSAIPDDVLAGFGLTRAEAQNLAYRALRAAADPLPVFPSSVSTVDDDLEDWLDAGSSVARMAVYGMTPGPLCCTLDGGAQITPELMTAAQFWPGPIEFIGTLDGNIKGDVEKLVSRERVAAHPIDAGLDAPRSWRLTRHDAAGAVVEDRTLVLGEDASPAPDPAKVESQKAAKAEADRAEAAKAKEDAVKAEAEAKADAKAEAKPEAKAEKAREAEAREKAKEEKADAEKADVEKAQEAPAGEDTVAEDTAKTETAKAEVPESDGEGDGSLKKKLRRVWPF